MKNALNQAPPLSHRTPPPSPLLLSLLRLLLLRLGRFGRFLAIAPHHDHAEETAHHGAAEQQQDDGDADGPDAGREEGLDRVRVVDEGLWEVFR
jgi:hypothetical protein